MKTTVVLNYFYVCILSIFLIFISDILIDKKILIYQSFIGQFDETRVNTIVDLYQRMQVWQYFIIPILLLMKIFLLLIPLYLGVILKSYKVHAKQLIYIIIKSQYIVVVNGFITILYFWITKKYHTISDLSIIPFSALSLFKPNEVEPWLVYPLSILSLFEVFYWVALIIQWKKLTGKSYGESFDFIGSTYGLGLLLWVLVVIFFTI
ncbi:hypothetical protein [Alistipes sp. ZOR0009]|uniref:hypothetical protein n=1 Tax=Alistipes sp. ZOR0009 TaxID=1339253 RepID=UPI0006479CBB|nr:hypothetical protein [Alistipes sp. ZOR0009]